MPRRVLQGIVVSNKSQKTVVVSVERRFAHPLQKKTVRRTKRYHAHDENETKQPGDLVHITECVPRSKRKHWEIKPAD